MSKSTMPLSKNAGCLAPILLCCIFKAQSQQPFNSFSEVFIDTVSTQLCRQQVTQTQVEVTQTQVGDGRVGKGLFQSFLNVEAEH